jgi:flavin reductase (DIM6/NTAB) family NADH-FMN oxidoreductase RutF
LLPELKYGAALDPKDFRRALGCFATGVTVVTTVAEDGRLVGLTANSFSSVSIDPPLVLWSLAKSSPSLATFEKSGYFGISVLAEEQLDLCNRFASPGGNKFAGVDYRMSEHGVPLLEGALAHFECARSAIYPGGDHVILVGKVLAYAWGLGPVPLLFCQGQLSGVPSPAALQKTA